MSNTFRSDPLQVQVIAYAPTAFYHCTHCEVAWREAGIAQRAHQEQLAGSLPSDLAQDYQLISDWVRELFKVHGDAAVVKVVDAASLEGLFKVLRYGTRQLPAVIVGRHARFSGRTTEVLAAARREIDRRLIGRQQPA